MSRDTFDYVVVGAGSAGCVVAARLAEDPDVTVCLVEAGPAIDDDSVRVPLFGGQLLRTRLDWDYDTHEEPHLNGRRLFLPRGRLVGGSSMLNGMIYIRGNPLDYDEWGQAGWSWADMLPAFIRSEDNERGADPWHGVGGPLAVSEGRSKNPISRAFIEAAEQAGYPGNDDFNGERQDGFGWYQVTQRNGERCSTAAFLAHERPNLTVRTNVQVHRIAFTGDRATGIVGARLDEPVEIRAEREVILCAGAYNSPQLLMLSGIGDAADLTALGIPVRVDQPEVGRNLQDHPTVSLVYGHSQPVSLLNAGDPASLRQWEEHRSGPLSSNAPEAGGFVRTDPGLQAPDVQFFVVPLLLMNGGLMVPSDQHGVTIGGCVLDARSRGRVMLSSPAPTAKPRIVHNYFGDDDGYDLAILTAAVRIGLQIARQPAMKPFTEQAYQVPKSESDPDLAQFARRHVQTQFHPAGTCAMGTVLDAQLRVRGVEGLRVADASVMPTLIRGNTNAPVIAIGERAADLIRNKVAPEHRFAAGSFVV